MCLQIFYLTAEHVDYTKLVAKHILTPAFTQKTLDTAIKRYRSSWI